MALGPIPFPSPESERQQAESRLAELTRLVAKRKDLASVRGTPQWETIKKILEEELGLQVRALLIEDTSENLYRRQGAVRVLNGLLASPEEAEKTILKAEEEASGIRTLLGK
jgi:hypothetical protein